MPLHGDGIPRQDWEKFTKDRQQAGRAGWPHCRQQGSHSRRLCLPKIGQHSSIKARLLWTLAAQEPYQRPECHPVHLMLHENGNEGSTVYHATASHVSSLRLVCQAP